MYNFNKNIFIITYTANDEGLQLEIIFIIDLSAIYFLDWFDLSFS